MLSPCCSFNNASMVGKFDPVIQSPEFATDPRLRLYGLRLGSSEGNDDEELLLLLRLAFSFISIAARMEVIWPGFFDDEEEEADPTFFRISLADLIRSFF